MKSKLLYTSLIAVLILPVLVGVSTLKVEAAVNYSRLIDDSVFSDSEKMSSSQIDSFLNSFANSCISTKKGFKAPDPTGYNPTDGFIFGGNVSAGRVIHDAAQAYDINPQVLLVTIQKEQGYVSGPGTYDCTNPLSSSAKKGYTQIMGYGCPDGGATYSYSGVNLYTIGSTKVTSVSGTCVNDKKKAGFSQQVIRAAWLLKFAQQRSLGNTDWAVIKGGWDNSDDPGTCYGGPMTQGYRKRCSSNPSATYYDGYTTIDGSSVHMDTGATAALYWYTPHKHGNLNFFNFFSSWFGNPSADTSKDKAIAADWDSGSESGTGVKRGNTYFLDNNNDGVANTAVGWGRTTDKLIVGDWDGDGVDEMGLRRGNQYFLDYDNNGRPNSVITYGKSTDGLVVGDWDGDGIDELGVKRGATYYLDYDNNGKADKKVAWGRATDVAFCGDWDGDGADELALRRGTDYFLDFDNNGRPNAVISWGRSTDKLIYGDWDDDGADEIGLRRANSYILDFDNNGSPNKAFAFGKTSDTSMVGDWDGDGADEIGLKRTNSFYLDDNLDGTPETSFIYTY